MTKSGAYARGAWIAAAAVLVLLGTILPAFCAGSGMTIKGSTTVLPIAQVAAEEFMNKNPGISISVQGGGSGVGIASLLDGTTDIADASRKIKDTEVQKARSKGVEPFENIIAMDGIAVVVHPSNPIHRLTRDQIRAVYTGRISDWTELGGRGSRIVVISRDTSSGTFEAFEELALSKDKVRPDAMTTASNQATAQIVAQTPDAIGYIGFGYVSPKVKAVEVDGVPCTRANILKGAYTLSRPLFMYTNGSPSGSVKKFIDFVLSPEGQKLVGEEGFVGLK